MILPFLSVITRFCINKQIIHIVKSVSLIIGNTTVLIYGFCNFTDITLVMNNKVVVYFAVRGVCNKIGTSGVAILAKYYGIPFYVCAPTSTIDMEVDSGDGIIIEQRPESEITELWYEKRMAPENVKAYNPAFDVTSADLVSAIITEKSICRAPFCDSLKGLFE